MKGGKKILVIGGGASGLMAAARAAELGADVLVLEKMDRPARKILITGNGRCNVATGHDLETAIAAFGPNGRFLYAAFSRFYAGDTVKMMEDRGVPLKLEPGARWFPRSDKVADVVDALVRGAVSAGARIQTESRAVRIETEENRVVGAVVERNERKRTPATEKGAGTGAARDRQTGGAVEAVRRPLKADCVILATGGLSYPATGSTGDGYRFARALGHTIIPPRPALVAVRLRGSLHKDLAPLSFRDVAVSLQGAGETLRRERGDMMFTPFGATGPAVLNLSKTVAERAAASPLSLVVDFQPDLGPEQVAAALMRDLNAAGRKSIKSVLETILPKRAVPAFLSLASLSPEKKACETSKSERETLARLLKGLPFPTAGVRPIEEATITAGGVDLKEVRPKTLESKIVKGLYFCGELLDLDGPTGGFNLQCAFSTGRLAGESAALEA